MAIPYLFWDLSEKKHRAIIEDLKLRAERQNVSDGYTDASILSSGEISDSVIREERELRRPARADEETAASDATDTNADDVTTKTTADITADALDQENNQENENA